MEASHGMSPNWLLSKLNFTVLKSNTFPLVLSFGMLICIPKSNNMVMMAAKAITDENIAKQIYLVCK